MRGNSNAAVHTLPCSHERSSATQLREQLGLKRSGLKMKALVVCTVIIVILVGTALACLWLKFWQFSGRYIWFLHFGILCRYLRYFIFMGLAKKFSSVLLQSCNKREFVVCCRAVGSRYKDMGEEKHSLRTFESTCLHLTAVVFHLSIYCRSGSTNGPLLLQCQEVGKY